ncbi:MAG: KilA-N domain-containing protein, partial [Proteobacteria bacterium]|nr:KilA-N domain-containing protein [Pseudomonadota bacterium]
MRLSETKKLIEKIENKVRNSEAVIPATKNENEEQAQKKIIEIHQAGNKYNQGTWIHPDLGINLAQWCSPDFSLQVSKWIRELIFTDRVELGNEKTE